MQDLHVFSTLAGPLIIGHRGASGHALENSLAAFRLAADRAGVAGCDGVELDVHVTHDGRFVVHHDSTISTGERISALSLSRVRATRLADGSEIPVLEEVLELLGGLNAFVEVKDLPMGSDANLLAMLRGYGADRTAVHAFDHRIISRLRKLDGSVSLGVLSRSYPVDPLEQVRVAGATTLWQECHWIDGQLAESCEKSGVALFAWTVNDAGEARRLASLGVTGLCGNWPERLRVAKEK